MKKLLVSLVLLTVCLPILAEEWETQEARLGSRRADQITRDFAAYQSRKRAAEKASWVNSLPTRTYTSKDGKTVYKGKFLYMENGKVFIQTKDEENEYVFLSKLSAADQTYIRNTIRQRKGLEVKKPAPKPAPKTTSKKD